MHQITCTNNQVIEQASSYLDCMSLDDDTEAKLYRSKHTARSLKPASPRTSPLHSKRSKASSMTPVREKKLFFLQRCKERR